MLLTTKAIVLSKKKLEDNDALVTLLTERSGKLKAIAKGAKSSRSMIAATTQPFTLGEFVLDLGSAWNRVRSVDVIETHRHVQENLTSMGYGAYFLELASHVLQDGEENREIYRLLSEVLKSLNLKAGHEDPEWLKVIYEFKLMTSLGYQIQLRRCVRCGAEGPHTGFSVPEGGAVCGECLTEEDDQIDRMLFNIMDYAGKQSVETLSKTKINRLYVHKLDILSMRFMNHHLGYQGFKSLEFLKAIRKV